ncbi:MAG: bifunctional folylpolyglutamate synthase/dihydrofolate synthase [Cyclobacteriaceae bacterium]
MNFSEAMHYLMQKLPMFQRQGKAALKPDLSNTIALMEGLGNPHFQFKSVHIAGTNGKGTSAHAIASILQAAGYSTGLYTSPHLKSFTERIRIGGKMISEESVAAFVTKYQSLIEEINPSFFEVTVAMAFDYFAREKVDIAVIETGLGGRLDSTNVIDPLVSLITMIDYDHADILGNTLEKIAGEKAGIIKANRPVVIGADQPDLLHVFRQKATSVNAHMSLAKHYQMEVIANDGINQVIRVKASGNKEEEIIDFVTDITAEYFVKNLAGILCTIDELVKAGFDINQKAISKGLKKIKTSTGLLGRWQLLSSEPKVFADISHNIGGVSALLKQIDGTDYNHLHLVYGTVRDKEVDKILALLPKNANYYFTQSHVPRSMAVEDLVEIAKTMEIVGGSFENVNDAIDEAKKFAEKNDLIVVFGSTFVVAEIDDL